MVQSKEEEVESAAAQRRHLGRGCININAIFHHFLQGRSRSLAAAHHNNHHLPPPPGYKGSHDDTPHANEASHNSMMKNSKPVIDKPRLSTDSSRSSVSSSCNSSSFFSSIEDTKITHQSSEKPTQQAPSDISKLVRDSILHRDVRGITVKAASKEESRGSLTYVDSPRPSLPSPKPNNIPKRFLGLRESLGALPTFHKLKNTESSSLLHKESPRYSYDGRESRPAVKIKELPRYSLDSKRPNCPPLDRVVPSNTNQELVGRHRRRQSSLVVKLMGLEDLEEPEKVGSLQISDTKPTSRNSRIVPVESKAQELEETQCLASEGNNVSSVYGQMDKRLGQLEFGKSGKDLRALKHVLQSMQNSKRGTETGTETETCSTPCSPTIKKTCSPKNTRTPKPTKKTETAKVSVSIVVPVPSLRKLDLGDKKPRGKKFLEEKRRGGSEKTKNQHSPRKTASPRLQKKKPNLSDSPESKNSAGRQTKNAASSQKSRSHRDQGSELSSDLSGQNNGVSLQSDGGISMSSSQEDMEVSSEYRPKKMELVEQLSPVSVLDARIYEDESPSPVKMISNAFEANTPHSKGRESISEILFASDLFRNLDSCNILTTQNTFLALEETKSNNLPTGNKLLERRLMFDVVTEILGCKFESYDPNCKLETKQQLLKGLCKEIDELPCKLDEEDEDCFRSMVEKDLNGDSVGWTTGSCDISGVAVDIERMIFRDLISEVVNTKVRTCGSSYRRKLF